MSIMLEMLPAAGPALVVGGGQVALRKVRNLVEGEFRVTVIAPVVLDEIRNAAWVTVLQRPFEDADLDAEPAFALVFACTDSRAVNQRVGQLARQLRIPVVVADAQGESTFFTPAVLRDGDLTVAVSTGGASPGVAKRVRERIAAALGPGWARVISEARHERAAGLARSQVSRRNDPEPAVSDDE